VALAMTVVLGGISDLLYVVAYQFRLDWLAEPARLIAAPEASAEILRWAALTDLFSYYLPTAVVALGLHAALRWRGPVLADVATLAALGYVLAGSVATSALAMGGPMLMHATAHSGADHEAIAAVFGTLLEIVFRGVWQLIDAILLGVWFIGIGLLLRRDQPRLARVSMVFGSLASISAAFNVLGLGLARDATLGAGFAIWTVWSIWVAVLLWRRRPPFGAQPPRTAA